MALLVAVLAFGSGTANASSDVTPPTLNLPAYASFIVGSTIGDSTSIDGDQPETYDIQQRVAWNATDASGICGYDISLDYAGGPPETIISGSTQTSYQAATTDYDDQQGGGSFKIDGWIITAHDCAGNITRRETSIYPVVAQEDGTTYYYSNPAIAYTGRWATSNCACWSGDQTRYTSTSGAKVGITRTYAAGQHVALVVERAPNRGKFKVLVDGVYRTTIDSSAPVATHRSVVWDAAMKAGRHKIELVNLATAGRPRIDLDAEMFS